MKEITEKEKEISFDQTNESMRIKKEQKKQKKQMPCKKKCMTKEQWRLVIFFANEELKL